MVMIAWAAEAHNWFVSHWWAMGEDANLTMAPVSDGCVKASGGKTETIPAELASLGLGTLVGYAIIVTGRARSTMGLGQASQL